MSARRILLSIIVNETLGSFGKNFLAQFNSFKKNSQENPNIEIGSL